MSKSVDDILTRMVINSLPLAHRYIDDKAIPADADWKEYL